ncbi:orotidine-5'-phosphate decarboxylase [Pseudomethylobacillus aquaticus]|uniref:Orotidine 5'-phosphate decarboxylase n=1 Tax=Pseudomethylobacillus aquaticus TaxID=2676064 RepID=A0A3N0V651_9PROT|nr:orotidine-5'-phosphate decarboxylase [Pseudomethylobacillus aquaticus]ROH88239.1 orotidine-5'-phosphate decarboxylase [Pseudomethylobacillus aquaticus]
MSHDRKIVVALDYADAASALALASQLDPRLCRVKVGKELFTASGPQLIEALHKLGHQVFLDLKFHDIPTTAGKACEAASRLGVWMLNVHASGGIAMMQAAREGVLRSGQSPLLIAVTVLTSMDQDGLKALGVQRSVVEQVAHLAGMTQQAGLDGVVCSAQEAAMLRAQHDADFCLVTPGIRPADASLDDQSRVVTPQQALRNGASYLVIGRPITKAADPLLALQTIQAGIAA